MTTPALPYETLLAQISETFEQGQRQATQAVNTHMVETYWRVGQHIVSGVSNFCGASAKIRKGAEPPHQFKKES
jgi:hypothetical protein